MAHNRFAASAAAALIGLSALPALAAQCTIHDLNSGAAGTWPQFIVPAFGQQLYINANIGGAGSELYRWNRATGFQLLDINPGSNNSNPQSLAAACTPVGPRVFLSARGATGGQELWMTDGSPAGTVRVRDILPGNSSSNPTHMFAGLDRVFFQANDGTNGRELWSSDGTTAGTQMILDINPGSGSSQPDFLALLGGRPVFTAWTPTLGRELYITDGTAAGTILLADIRPGSSSSSIFEAVVLGDRAYFATDDGVNGSELWATDGTPAGTAMLVNLAQNAGSSSPLELTKNGDELFFVATDGFTGQELYKTDGTPAGTVLVKDVRPGALSSQPRDLIASNGLVFFSADSVGGAGRELWVSDGTSAGTVEIDINPAGNSFPQSFVAVGTGVCFAATDAMGSEPWFSDGTVANTFRVCDIDPGAGSSTPQNLIVAAGRVFFQASDPALGNEVHEITTPGALAERRGHGALPSHPELVSRGGRAPVLGTTVDLDSTGPATGLGVLTVGFGKLPLPGTPGLTVGACDWTGVTNNTAVVAVLGFGPTFSYAFAIPNVPGYTGLDLAFQTVWLVSGQTPAVEPSNGLQLVLGGPVPM